jgi:hypothetical protein
LEFRARLLGGESPLYRSLGLVTLPLPGGDFSLDGGFLRQAVGETLAGQHREFNLYHVAPTAVLGRVVKLQVVRSK